MAYYSGNIKDFEKYIGPRLRNIVQTNIAKRYKQQIGQCEHCGSQQTLLEAAHKHGRDRKSLIKSSYEKYSDGTQLTNVDINEFEQFFKSLHFPLQDNFLVLCNPCHRKYDNVSEQIEIIESKNVEITLSNTLDIQLYPEDADEFKELLIQHRSAYIKIFYSDEKVSIKEWKAEKFNENSDVMKNLRSRPEFRQDEWKKLNIQKVEVEINY